MKRKLGNALTMLVVTGLSLFLVVYVGFGEAQRTYTQFQVDKLHALGRLMQTAMASYLRAGLPLRQYVGFQTRAEAILASDPSIALIAVFNPDGRPVFVAGVGNMPILPVDGMQSEEASDSGFILHQNDDFLQVVLPLENKFESVGYLAVTSSRTLITQRLEKDFQRLLVIAGILSIGFAWFATVIGPRLAGYRTPWLQITFAIVFMSMSALVVWTLVSLYSEGAQVKTKSLADSLGQRLRDVVDFNLNITELEGLDQVFEQYRRLNPDISAVSLILNDRILIDTNPDAVGKPWTQDEGAYEYVIDLTRPDKSDNRIHVAVSLPNEVVYNQVARSVKNFGALFIASAFLAGLFLHFARSLEWVKYAETGSHTRDRELLGEFDLSIVKGVFFVAVFAEHLTYSFLPQFVSGIISDTGVSPQYISAPFMAYYLCFALTLIPAGHYAHSIGARRLIYLGLSIAALSLLTMAFAADIVTVVLARAAAGIGQGALFIGVQCYILARSSPNKKTQGAAIIVYGFQGGMISGMAIGSLLVVYLGAKGIFIVAGGIAVIATAYTIFLLPSTSPGTFVGIGTAINLRKLFRDLAHVLRNIEFIRTIMLIGIPAKAVMTGVIIFALPLLLSGDAYAQEDIGQIIMLYAIGVLVANRYVSQFVDHLGRTESILFWGAILSGIGLILIGTVNQVGTADGTEGGLLRNLTMIGGVTIVGLAHGFINAPVITRIADSKLAREIGANSATASYRFLERVGHVAGPILVGQLFLMMGQQPTAVAWIGISVIVFGVVFILSCSPAGPGSATKELAHEHAS